MTTFLKLLTSFLTVTVGTIISQNDINITVYMDFHPFRLEFHLFADDVVDRLSQISQFTYRN